MADCAPPTPTDDDKTDFLLSCRFGDLDDVQHFAGVFSDAALFPIDDEHGNTPLHMAAANGHTDVIAYLLPRLPPRALAQPNDAGSTPLHWAALNQHLDAVRTLVQFPGGTGVDLIDVKNAAGRTPLGEAELVGWDEGARWLVQVMKLGESTEAVEEEVDPEQAIKVEIQDAEGKVARMTIDPNRLDPDHEPS